MAKKKSTASRFDKYLEEKGMRHFAALVMLMYIMGTIIFNVYLRALGIFEFELIQLRYIFVGGVFAFMTFFIVLAILGSVFLYRQIIPPSKKKLTKAQRAKRLFFIEMMALGVLIPWVGVYALYVFPQIPSGYGGAKPIPARLIGDPEQIQKINAMIAYETGVEESKLPYEIVSANNNMAIGANVKILDQNRNRIWLILTKELYLTSTSNLAQKLMDAGADTGIIETSQTQNFRPKPLFVKADRIESISFSLYEPPEILTSQDLEIASQVLSATPEKPSRVLSSKEDSPTIVESFITEQAPVAAPKIIAKVKAVPAVDTLSSERPLSVSPIRGEEASVNAEIPPKAKDAKEAETNDAPEGPSVGEETPPTEVTPKPEPETELEALLKEVVDTKFLDLRAQFYTQASQLYDKEQFSDTDLHQRFLLSKKIAHTLKRTYPDAWSLTSDTNYLASGQTEEKFLWKLMEIFRGVESIEVLVVRLNEMKLEASTLEEAQKKAEILKTEEEATATQPDSDATSETTKPQTSPAEGEEPTSSPSPSDSAPSTPPAEETTTPATPVTEPVTDTTAETPSPTPTTETPPLSEAKPPADPTTETSAEEVAPANSPSTSTDTSISEEAAPADSPPAESTTETTPAAETPAQTTEEEDTSQTTTTPVE